MCADKKQLLNFELNTVIESLAYFWYRCAGAPGAAAIRHFAIVGPTNGITATGLAGIRQHI